MGAPTGYIGIDLGCSAASRRPTSGVAILDSHGKLLAEPSHFRSITDLQAVLFSCDLENSIVAVDAPRSVPDHREENYSERSCERDLRAETKGFVGTFSGVAALYFRWYEIESRLFSRAKVIETYPGQAWGRLQLPGRPKEYRRNRTEIMHRLAELVGGAFERLSHHQADAIICAYTAWCYQQGQINWYGTPGEGLLILPAHGRHQRPEPVQEEINADFRRFPSMVD